MYRVWNFIANYSLLLLSGAAVALFWANTHPESYHHLVHYVLVEDFLIGEPELEGGSVTRTLTLHFLVNDVLMALFFAIAAKEVWEAVVEASSSRFRPIMLTALSTVLGMIPIAPTVFWGSMAYAIMGGLLVASLLTLIFLPTLYVTWFKGVPPKASRDTTAVQKDAPA